MRAVVDHLLETDGEVTVRELAARFVVEDGFGNEVGTIRLALYHDHLPRLAEIGPVAFDPRGDRCG